MAFLDLARKRLFSRIFTPHQIRFFSSSATLNPVPNPHQSDSFVVKDYLMSTFGFSAAKAATVSKPIAHLKTPLNPDAVRSFLHHQGFGEAEIATIITRRPTILCSSPENTIAPKLRALRDMGLSTSALRHIILSGPDALKSFGWSEEEFFSALRKAPSITWLSKENLCTKMGFLLGEAKCDLLYITSHPLLLKYSLEKRLKPRHHVLSILESKDLRGKRKDFHSAIRISDNMFVAKYIVPHQEELPGLRDVYLASCA